MTVQLDNDVELRLHWYAQEHNCSLNEAANQFLRSYIRSNAANLPDYSAKKYALEALSKRREQNRQAGRVLFRDRR